MLRRQVVGTGWKLYVNSMREAGTLMEQLRQAAEEFPEIETFLFPAAPQLPLAAELLAGSRLGYGLQSICVEEAGSFTGENSILLLKDLGGCYAEIGHAERRALAHEGDDDVNQKMRLCQKHDIRPVVCVGEREADLSKGQGRLTLKSQCLWALDGMEEDFFPKIILVYEPVWAIGGDRPAEPAYVQETHAFLRECVAREHGKTAAERLRIMYGGSNTPETSRAFIAQDDIDGLFVGRSALKPGNFRAILDVAAHCG